jgi:hypothetical protein
MVAPKNWAEHACKLALVACLAFACGGRAERAPNATAGSGAGGSSSNAGGSASGAAAGMAMYCDVYDQCPEGGCCVHGSCLAEGEPCEGVGPCVAGQCTECGELGERCCPSPGIIMCGAAYECSICNDLDAVCGADFTCQTCGHDGQSCCGLVCLDSPSLCLRPDVVNPQATVCTTTCGKAGEPCCDDVRCTDGSCCLPTPNGSLSGTCVTPPTCGCDAGTCTTCGAEGLPCCDQGICIDGLQCSTADTTGTCRAPRKR